MVDRDGQRIYNIVNRAVGDLDMVHAVYSPVVPGQPTTRDNSLGTPGKDKV